MSFNLKIILAFSVQQTLWILFNSKFWIGNAVFQSNCIQLNLIESNWIQLSPKKIFAILKYVFREKKISIHFDLFSFIEISFSLQIDNLIVVHLPKSVQDPSFPLSSCSPFRLGSSGRFRFLVPKRKAISREWEYGVTLPSSDLPAFLTFRLFA